MFAKATAKILKKELSPPKEQSHSKEEVTQSLTISDISSPNNKKVIIVLPESSKNSVSNSIKVSESSSKSLSIASEKKQKVEEIK